MMLCHSVVCSAKQNILCKKLLSNPLPGFFFLTEGRLGAVFLERRSLDLSKLCSFFLLVTMKEQEQEVLIHGHVTLLTFLLLLLPVINCQTVFGSVKFSLEVYKTPLCFSGQGQMKDLVSVNVDKSVLATIERSLSSRPPRINPFESQLKKASVLIPISQSPSYVLLLCIFWLTLKVNGAFFSPFLSFRSLLFLSFRGVVSVWFIIRGANMRIGPGEVGMSL